MKTLVTLSFALLLAVTGCAQNGVRNIAASELEKVMQQNIILVDVRTADEYKSGHLTNAVNIDWYDPAFMEKMQQFNKKTPVYMYCRSGNRSGQAAQKLVNSGFKTVYSLEGGISVWQNSQKTVQK